MMDIRKGNFRWTVVALLFVATTINYLDRQVIGLLKPTLEKEFSWSEQDYSRIVMAFSTAYALGFLLIGGWIDRVGTKKGYFFSVFFWSLAAVGHALARTTFGFGVARAFLGLSEAGNFPAAIKVVAEWFPKKERALATGIFNSGANVGAFIAPIMVPAILGAYGWEEAFIVTGAIGFVWLLFWWRMYEIPARQKKLSAEEFQYIRAEDTAEDADTGKVKWLHLFSFRQTWAFIFGKFFTDPVWYFFLFWLPSYFATTFQLDLKKPSLELVVVYTATTIGSIGGGYLPGYLIRKGWSVNRARKTVMFFFACCVVPIILARYTTDIWQAVALISLATAAHQAWSANVFTTVSDMFPLKAVSSVVGIGSMAGSVGGILFPIFIGWVLDHYKALGNIGTGYNIIFIICGCSYLVGWLLMHLAAPTMKKAVL